MGLFDEVEYEDDTNSDPFEETVDQSFEVSTVVPDDEKDVDESDLPFIDVLDELPGVSETLPSLGDCSRENLRVQTLRDLNSEIKDFTDDIATRRMEEEDEGKYKVTDFVYDVQAVRLMGQSGTSVAEMAAFFGVPESTVEKQLADKDSDFCKVYYKSMAMLGISLRQAQIKSGLAGDSKMLVHLGKHVLGQVDNAPQPKSLGDLNDPTKRKATIRRLTQTIEEFEV